MRDLDYQGLDLPILTDKELLEQTWNLEDQPEQTVATNDQGGLGEVGEGEADERGKRALEEEEGGVGASRKKKARVENEVEQQEQWILLRYLQLQGDMGKSQKWLLLLL